MTSRPNRSIPTRPPFHSERRSDLRIVQCNVGRRLTVHDTLLSLAHEQNVDILLIQEPWIHSELSLRRTRGHPSYIPILPSVHWQSRPRVAAYSSRSHSLCIEQLPSPCPRDLLSFHCSLRNGPTFTITNLYNAPLGSSEPLAAVAALTTTPPGTGRWLIAGDFNLPHASWDNRDGTASPQAAELEAWTAAHDIHLLTPTYSPTHDAGGILDLTWASGTLLERQPITNLEASLEAGSDHRPLLTTIPGQYHHSPNLSPPLSYDYMDTDAFLKALHLSLQGYQLPSLDSAAGIDSLASFITTSLTSAIRQTTPVSSRHGRSLPYWSQECKDLSKELRSATSALQLANEPVETDAARSWVRTCRHQLSQTLRRSRSQYYNNRTEAARSASDVSKLTHWARRPFSALSGPLVNPSTGTVLTTITEKQDLLMSSFTDSADLASDDLSVPSPLPPSHLPFPPLSTQEVTRACLNVSSTTPGSDAISLKPLNLAWPLIHSHILALFQACVNLGHHPSPFKHATMIVIPKVNKPDKSHPRSFRPISLLSVLGKGLERVLAKRFAFIALEHKIVGSQQFGALPRRSAVDLTSMLTHDVELAFARREVASLLTLDIQGAFDAVCPGRLRHRLIQQGWPLSLANWSFSFMSHRQASLSFDQNLSLPYSLQRGLPQGSPVSPILFLLYIAPLHNLPLKSSRFSYVDDFALLATSDHARLNVIQLREDLEMITDWGRTNGIAFAPEKTELIHFSRKRDQVNPGLYIHSPDPRRPIQHVPATPLSSSLRWLGVEFDRKLFFKAQARKATQRGRAMATLIRSLSNTVRGLSSSTARTGAIASVLPSVLYAAETWWCVPTDGTRRHDGSSYQIAAISSVLQSLGRAILPVWRTFPSAAVLREAGLPPAREWLNECSGRLALRLHRLDDFHPLRTRAFRLLSHASPHSNTRLSRALSLLPGPVETSLPPTVAPWQSVESPSEGRIRLGLSNADRSSFVQSHLSWLSALPAADIVVYSDGSKLPDGSAGSGWAGFRNGREIFRGKGSHGTSVEVYDAEAIAALGGLLMASALNPPGRLHIFLDNYSVASRLGQVKVSFTSSQSIFDQFHHVFWSWNGPRPHIHWCPAHTGIPGNELADAIAKDAAASPSTRHLFTQAAAKRYLRAVKWTNAHKHWVDNMPTHYAVVAPSLSALRPPPELSLPRFALGKLLASRSGHGDFQEYHLRFAHTDAVVNCNCGSPKTPTHFWYCPLPRPRIANPYASAAQGLPFILSSHNGARRFAAWVKDAQFYSVCSPFRPPPHPPPPRRPG